MVYPTRAFVLLKNSSFPGLYGLVLTRMYVVGLAPALSVSVLKSNVK